MSPDSIAVAALILVPIIWVGTMVAMGVLVRRTTGWPRWASAVLGILLGNVLAYGVCNSHVLRF